MSLGPVREQTVQKEEGEQVPILCRIYLRRVAQYRLQILKIHVGRYILRDRLDLPHNFPSPKEPN